MRVTECSRCGCRRLIIVRAKVSDQESGTSVTFRPLCLHCFAEIARIFTADAHEDTQVTLATLKDKL